MLLPCSSAARRAAAAPDSRHRRHRGQARIAGMPKGPGGTVAKGQRLICRCLGLPADAEEETEEARKKLMAVLDNNLAPSQMAALDSLARKATLRGTSAQVTPTDV